MVVLYSKWIFFALALAFSSLWLLSDATRIEDIRPGNADHDTCVLEFDGKPECLYNNRTRSAIMNCSLSSNSKGGTYIHWFYWLDEIKPIEDKYIIEDYTLIVTNYVQKDDGFYLCLVGNQCGTISHTFNVNSQGITTHIYAPVVESIDNQKAVVGENVTFSCKIVKSNVFPISLTWFKHSKVNGSFTQEDMYQSGDLNTTDEPHQLVLTNVTLDDAGRYNCSVGDDFSVTARNAYLKVFNKTELSTSPDTYNTTDTTSVKYEVLETSSNKKDGLHQNIVIYSTVIGSVVIVLVLVIILLYIIRKKRSQTSAESAISESYPLEDFPRVSNVSAEINVDHRNRRISSGIANSSDIYLPWDIANSSDFYLPSSIVNSSDSC